jgi:acetate kinase
VSCHLGSGGASLCAIVNGRSIDNTMGYSPLQGLVMSTRSGDLDPAVALTLLVRAAGNSAAVESLLNRKSGVLGLSGMSADIRDVVARATDGAAEDIDQVTVASQVYLWRIRKYLGAYLTLVGRAHCVILTDTIGERRFARLCRPWACLMRPRAWSCTAFSAARNFPAQPRWTRTPLSVWTALRASHPCTWPT